MLGIQITDLGIASPYICIYYISILGIQVIPFCLGGHRLPAIPFYIHFGDAGVPDHFNPFVGYHGYLPFALPIKPGGQPNQWPAAPFLTCAVVMGKKVLKKDIKTKVARVQWELPFQPSPRTFQPRSMKDRQHAWVLAGLKYLKAPMVIWLDN